MRLPEDQLALFGSGHSDETQKNLLAEYAYIPCPSDGRPCHCPNRLKLAMLSVRSQYVTNALIQAAQGRLDDLEAALTIVEEQETVTEMLECLPERAAEITEKYEAYATEADGQYADSLADSDVGLQAFSQIAADGFCYQACHHIRSRN